MHLTNLIDKKMIKNNPQMERTRMNESALKNNYRVPPADTRVIGEFSLADMQCVKNESPITCVYCARRIPIGGQIYGYYGIRWGHFCCIRDAFEEKRLIRSPRNASKRPKGLLKFMKSSRKGGLKKKLRKKESMAITKRPDTQPPSSHKCGRTDPIFIEKLVMPEEMRPHPHHIERELSNIEFSRLLSKVWRKLVKDRFSHYVRTMKSLPSCPCLVNPKLVVSPIHGTMTLLDSQAGGPAGTWSRDLWWICRKGSSSEST
jgi:hypothetical protein